MNFGSLLNCILRYSHVAAQNLPQKQEAWLWMRRPAVGSEAIFRCWDYQGTSSTHRHGFVAFEKQQHSHCTYNSISLWNQHCHLFPRQASTSSVTYWTSEMKSHTQLCQLFFIMLTMHSWEMKSLNHFSQIYL